MDEIVNKIEQSGLIQLDVADFVPVGKRMLFDLKEALWQEMALKEKDFRDYLKGHDWEQYKDAHVSITCSVDAIIPLWAYMLVTSYLSGIADTVFVGTSEEQEKHLISTAVQNLDFSEYNDKRIIIKGCSDRPIPNSVYALLVEKLQPYVKSLMFGEACSTVPVYKKKK